MTSPVAGAYLLLLLPRLYLAGKALKSPLPASKALLFACASVTLSLLAGAFVWRFAPSIFYMGTGFFLYSLEAPGLAPLIGLLVLGMSAAVPLAPGILLEYALLRPRLEPSAAVKTCALSFAYSLLLFAGTVSAAFALHGARVASRGSTYLAPEWRDCSSDAECVAVRYGCDSYMGSNREHEEESKAALYAMSGDPKTMNCSSSSTQALEARCLDRRCAVVP